MSLAAPCSHGNYYPDGEPIGGSFLLENSGKQNRRKGDGS